MFSTLEARMKALDELEDMLDTRDAENGKKLKGLGVMGVKGSDAELIMGLGKSKPADEDDADHESTQDGEDDVEDPEGEADEHSDEDREDAEGAPANDEKELSMADEDGDTNNDKLKDGKKKKRSGSSLF